MGIGKHTKPTKTRPSRGRKTPTDGVPQALTPEQVIAARRKQLRNRRDVTSFLQRLVIMVLMLWVLFGFVFGLTPMPNGDMSPRLSAGDLMLYYRMASTWHTQDIAVLEKDGTQYVARIVAQPGDTVEITKEATLKINDSVVLENDIYYSTPRYDETVTIYGLSANDEYQVTEDDANTDGYTTTYESCNEDEAGAMGTDDVTATVTNTRETTPPTGVIMTIAPYALMVVLAGAFAVVFLTRRNRAE